LPLRLEGNGDAFDGVSDIGRALRIVFVHHEPQVDLLFRPPALSCDLSETFVIDLVEVDITETVCLEDEDH
jgi:hypothetical protein